MFTASKVQRLFFFNLATFILVGLGLAFKVKNRRSDYV